MVQDIGGSFCIQYTDIILAFFYYVAMVLETKRMAQRMAQPTKTRLFVGPCTFGQPMGILWHVDVQRYLRDRLHRRHQRRDPH